MFRSTTALGTALFLMLSVGSAVAAEKSTATPAAPPTAASPNASATAMATPTKAPLDLTGLKVGQQINVADIPALRNIIPGGTEVRYIGNEYGLNGYFLSKDKTGKVLYITPDNQGIIDGMIYSGDGSPTTLQQLSRLKDAGFDPAPFIGKPSDTTAQTSQATTPPPTPATVAPSIAAASQPAATQPMQQATKPTSDTKSPGEMLWQETNNASWIAFGNTNAPQLTVFMDRGCNECMNFFRTIYPLTQSNKLYLRVIPVTVIDPKNTTITANVLGSPSPAAAWVAVANGQTIPQPANISEQIGDAIKANNTLFFRWKLPGTPYLIYRDATQSKVKVLIGEPDNLKTLLTELGIG